MGRPTDWPGDSHEPTLILAPSCVSSCAVMDTDSCGAKPPHDGPEHSYSPIILTSTRFRRRPSNSRVSHPADTRSAPTCQSRVGRWSLPPPPRAPSPAASGARLHCPLVPLGTGLTRAVVQPAFGPAASLMRMRGVMFRALTRVSTLFIIYRSHTPDCRGHCGHRPCPEQPQLNPASEVENAPIA